MPRLHLAPSVAALALVAALTACASPAPEPVPTAEPESSGHGTVAGAAELDEAPLHLTTIDTQGAVSQLDLLSEASDDLGIIEPPLAMVTDGRYLFASTGDGVSIVDSGVWTWDHVDHFHYYRGEPQLLGDIDGTGIAHVTTTNSSTTGGAGVYFPDSGDAVLLDVKALSTGEIVEQFRLQTTPHAGYVVPVGSFALVTDADGTVSTVDATGAEQGTSEQCVAPTGTITTRVGSVIGCQDAALLASMQAGELVIERITLPDGVTLATGFAGREGRPSVAGLSASGSILLLDTRARTWTQLPAPAPLAQVNAVDDAAGHLLALTEDGRLFVMSAETGATLATAEPVVGDVANATLIADDRRAYLSDPGASVVYEIDFADAARVARTFTFDPSAMFVAETGR